MKDKFYIIAPDGVDAPLRFDDLEMAKEQAKKLSDKFGKPMKVLTCTSTSLITPDEINVKVDSFETALEYLGRENNACMYDIPGKHAKAMVAMYKLITIAEAWNKADNFVPDFSNRNQYKYFPWFVYDDKSARLEAAATANAALTAYAAVGSRLCFKTEGRAKQFGEQFIDLFIDFLLFN